MFIGNVVRLNQNVKRNNEKDMRLIEHAYRENWLWLVVSMDDEDLDYIIKPMYLEGNMIELGVGLLVLSDEIKKVKMSREQIFNRLNSIRCNFG